MAELPRLNNVIKALESGKATFTSFCQADPESAIAMSTAKYDGIVYEMEHNPWDIRALRDSLQYMLNRGQIAKSGSLSPSVTPMVRIPPNGAEKAQFQAKQALDLGAYGIVWPHISSVEEAHNAVAACRYPRRRADRRRALLGAQPAGLLRPRRRVAAQSQGRSVRDPDDGGHARHRGAARHHQEGARHRRDPHRRGRSLPGARLPPAIRASRGAQVDGAGGRHLQAAQRGRRPPPRRCQQRRAHPRRGLPLSDGRAGAQLRRAGQGAQARRTGVGSLVIAGLDPAIHRLRKTFRQEGWTRGSSPRVTDRGVNVGVVHDLAYFRRNSCWG